MAAVTGPNIINDASLKVMLDVDNPRCYSAGVRNGLPSGQRLYNLVEGQDIDYFWNDASTEAYQNVVSHQGHQVLFHDALQGSTKRDTTWRANATTVRVNSYTFISWFNFDNTGQQSENIYGGGFDGRTSFYMSPGGTSESDGVLLYSDAGGTNGYSYNPGGGNDGQWHMRAYTVTGPDIGTQTLKYYRDGIQRGNTGYTNSSHDNPDGSAWMRWSSWTAGYGNLKGYLNQFMYYERVLSADEIMQIYKSTKNRYQ